MAGSRTDTKTIAAAPSTKEMVGAAIKAANKFSLAQTLVYDRSANPSIGITADPNAIGHTYHIADNAGNVIISGTIKSDRTFFIPTKNLKEGTYQFSVGGHTLQRFTIK